MTNYAEDGAAIAVPLNGKSKEQDNTNSRRANWTLLLLSRLESKPPAVQEMPLQLHRSRLVQPHPVQHALSSQIRRGPKHVMIGTPNNPILLQSRAICF